MIILIDFDQVIYDQLSEALEIYNSRYGTNIRKEDIKDYSLPQDILDCMGEVKYLGNSIDNAEYWIRELMKNHEIYLLTASMKENFMDKVAWIERNLPELGYKRVILSQDKCLINADVIVDDYQYNILGHPAKYRFLIEAPYNEHITPSDRIVKVKNLQKVVELLDGLRG